MTQIPIIILSLPDSKERREIISHRLENLGLMFEFRDAWTPKNIPEEILKIINFEKIEGSFNKSKTLLPTEIACYASHMGIILDVAHGKIPSPVLILEDDAILNKKSVFFAKKIYNLMKTREDIEYVNFENTKGPYIIERLPVLDDTIIFIPWYSSLRMAAYMLSREGARKILQLKTKGTRPIDMEIRYAIWEENLKYWEAFPSMAKQDGMQNSTIDPIKFRTQKFYRKQRKEHIKKMKYIFKKHGVKNFIKFYPIFIGKKLWRKILSK